MKKILITGASGFLGWNFASICMSHYSIIAVCNSNPVTLSDVEVRNCDITDYHRLKDLFHSMKPDAVIHLAAASNPNYCQIHPEETFRVNVTASSNIAGICADLQSACVFTSSDLIFNGKNPPYTENDAPSPVNTYGEQKLTAEQQMRLRYDNVTICRMPLMYGDAPENAGSFIKSWIEQLKNGNQLKLFTDEMRTPVSAHDACKGLLLALERPGEIIHLGGPERLSRYEMGQILSESIGIPLSLIKPCKQKDVPMAAPRPSDVSLDSSKALRMGYCPGKMSDEIEKLRCIKN